MKRLTWLTKVYVQRLVNRVGYRLEKLENPIRPIDVFDLAVRKRAAERGRDFFFVQVGAHDGSTLDPIRRYVTEYHWAGVLVEPQPAVFEQLRSNYAGESQLRFENAAVARSDGTAILFTVEADPGSPTYLASFDRGLLVKQVPAGTTIRSITVPAVSITTLLARHQVPTIDLLQLDTEGFDYEILKAFDLRSIRPAIIHYEHFHLSSSDRRAAQEYLAAYGYRFWVSGQDTTAVLDPGREAGCR